MRTAGVLAMVLWLATLQGMAAPPSPFAPPAPGAPSLHASAPSSSAGRPAPAAQPTSPPTDTTDGWEMLRREPLAGGTGSPAGQAWRWLVGLVVALALIRWGLPRALRGGSKGQFSQWLHRLAPPPSEGTITVLDSRFLGASALHLVSVRGRVLLIGSTAQQVNLLMDLTEQPDTASVFDQVLSQATPFTPEPTLQDEACETAQLLEGFRQRLRAVRERLAA